MTTPRTPLKKLSDQHEVFCLECVKSNDKLAKSYAAAGFRPAGGARQSAWRLRHEPIIEERIRVLRAEKFKALHMEVDEILARAAMIARADVRSLYDEHGALLNPADLEEQAAAGVAGIEVFEEFSGTGKDRVKIGETKKVRLRDPMPAIRLLAEHKKLVKVPDEGLNALASALADRLKAARERKRKEPKP